MTLPTMTTELPNLDRITMRDLTVWHSYGVPVAFQVTGKKLAVSRNQWTMTTGKHLNRIDGGNRSTRRGREIHDARLEYHAFTALLSQANRMTS